MRTEIARTLARERRRQSTSLMRVYNYYRIVVAISLLFMFVQEIGERVLGALDPDRFLITAAVYLLANVLVAGVTFVLPSRWIDRQGTSMAIVLLDIVALLLLLHFSGGITSGIGSLIIVAVALGSIMINGNVSMMLPAFATIGLLYEEFYLSLLPHAPSADLFQAGVLGAIYFGSNALIQTLSRRLRRLEESNMERALRLASLERLNREIVQRMHTGILVVDTTSTPTLQNEAARELLGRDTADSRFTHAQLEPRLRNELERWRRDRDYRPASLESPTGTLLKVSFSAVSTRRNDDSTIIFLEDLAEIAQQAQNLKLAGLGRLSASIAHEIRNPLGAISHAGQLLAESPNLDKHDLRLTNIIATHCRRMNEIIENVLQLSRRRAAEPELLELRPWIEAFMSEFRESGYPELTCDLRVDPPDIRVRADPRQLRQVISNLVQNGERYSRKASGESWIGIHAGQLPGTERSYLDIIDKGPGVPEPQVENLFEPFFTTEHTGTGLGLYISRELCEANQASLTYDRAETGGSRFRISFPHPDRQSVSNA